MQKELIQEGSLNLVIRVVVPYRSSNSVLMRSLATVDLLAYVGKFSSFSLLFSANNTQKIFTNSQLQTLLIYISCSILLEWLIKFNDKIVVMSNSVVVRISYCNSY